MPLLDPKMQDILAEAGLSKALTKTKSVSISEKLDAAGLSLDACFENLSDLVAASDSSRDRHAALVTALKAHRVLDNSQNNGAAMPIINIVINDSEKLAINPIVIPRPSAFEG